MSPTPSGRTRRDPFDVARCPLWPALEPGWLVDRQALAANADASGAAERPRRSAGSPEGLTPRHPLAGSSLLRGLPAADLAHLTTRFLAATPRSEWSSRRAAFAHLESLLRVWPVRGWDVLRGMHVVLGAAGSGKTTLVLKLAQRLVEARRRVALVSLFPTQHLQAAAFEAAAGQLGIPAALAATEDAWDDALGSFAAYDAILVDTPCMVSDPGTPRRLLHLPALRHASTVLHYNICLHHERQFLERQFELVAASGVDFVALSQVDLAPGPGALVALQLRVRFRLSLVNADPDLEGPLVCFGTDAVLAALTRPEAD